MNILKRVAVIAVAILLMLGNVSLIYLGDKASEVQTVLAGMSVVVTAILGLTTYIQTKTQIKLDKQDKTPFYELCFPDLGDNFVENFYCRNCIPVRKIGDDGFIDLEFENTSGTGVSSVEVTVNGVDLGMKSSSKKIESIENQEKKITDYYLFLKNATEEEIGNGLVIFEKWLECDTGKNSNYDVRARELILHFYYYYNCDFNSDLTPYRALETSNDERKRILERIIAKGTEKSESFYKYFDSERDSILHWLHKGRLEWVENKGDIKENLKYENLDVDHNSVINADKFHYYIPFENLKKTNPRNVDITLKIQTIHGYKYTQEISMVLDDKEKIDLTISPDEADINSKRKSVRECSYYEDERCMKHEQNELEEMLEKRAKARVYINSFQMSIQESK